MMVKKDKLKSDFYLRDNVVEVARDLLGKKLVTQFNGLYTSGIITETEAYNGVVDKASHAYGNRRTGRTEVMYQNGGIAYVYLCYGIHSLFNVVTNRNEIPHAVLIRSIRPEDGLDVMSQRVGKVRSQLDGVGPGKVTKLLGITFRNNKEDLVKSSVMWIEDIGVKIPENDIISSARIGVEYAKEDALLPYRFFIKDNNNKGQKVPPL